MIMAMLSGIRGDLAALIMSSACRSFGTCRAGDAAPSSAAAASLHAVLQARPSDPVSSVQHSVMQSLQVCSRSAERRTERFAAAVLQARTRRLASDVQSLQRQLEAKDAAMAQMHNRISEQEGVVTSQKALIQQMEEDIFRSAGC